MLTKDGHGPIKIVNFMTPGRGFYARVWPYKMHVYCENAFFLFTWLSNYANTAEYTNSHLIKNIFLYC